MRGTKGVGNIANPKEFMKATVAAKKVLADNAVTGQGLPTYGTQVLMNVINEIGALPTRNHRDVQFEGAKDISAEAMATPRKTDGKKHAGDEPGVLRLHHCLRPRPEDRPEALHRGEQAAVLGRLGRSRVRSGLGARRGQRRQRSRRAAVRQRRSATSTVMDPISFGATIGAVMELYEMGVLTKEQLGIDAKFGSAQALAHFAEITVQGRGLRQGDRPRLGAADEEVRPPGPVDDA